MDDERVIEQAEEQLRSAMLCADLLALDGLVADTAIYIDQAGNRLGKADDMAVHASGLLNLIAFAVMGPPLIRCFENVAIVWLRVELAGSLGGNEFLGTFAYTRIWRRQGDAWKVEAAHCSQVQTPQP